MYWNPALVAALGTPVTDYVSPGYHLTRGYTMRKYQVRASQKLFLGTPVRDPDTGFYVGPERDGTNVHIDMGLGKTIIGLTAIVDWFRWGICRRPVLVLAPLKVCQTVWAQEALQWSHTRHLRIGKLLGNERDRAFMLARAYNEQTGVRGYDIILCNPEKLPWLIKYLRGKWEFFDALVIDDVALKDPKSKQFKVLTNYGEKVAIVDPLTGKAAVPRQYVNVPPHRFKRAAKLTGTPSTSGLHRLWAPNYIMDHGARLMRDYGSFEARFFHKGQQVAEHVHKVELNKEEGEARPAYIARTGAPERMHELIADITIELNAEDYGVLPRTIGDASKSNLDITTPSHIHRVELPGEWRAKYDQLEKEALIELAGNTVMAQNGGSKSMMCWQIANGALYVENAFGQKEAQEVHTAKLDKMVEVIEMIDANMLIPYWFQHDFERIRARLEKEKMAYAYFTSRNAERIVKEFSEGRIPILLIHPQSAGHGIDRLQFGGHHLLWFSQIWSLERYLQTNARLARSGQSEIVGIHHIVTTKTTDELMMSNYRQNGDDQERFRAALREYQKLRGIDFITQGGLNGF